MTVSKVSINLFSASSIQFLSLCTEVFRIGVLVVVVGGDRVVVAGQAVVQIVEDTRTREQQAIKFFLSDGALLVSCYPQPFMSLMYNKY